MRADPEVRHLMDEASSNCWIGYRRHIMAYPIQEGKLYNLVMSHPGKAAVGKWNEPGNLDEMKAQYKGWDPVICKVLEKVEYCLKWTLADLPVLPRWVSKSGRVVLIGDAAHAMVPYLAQVCTPTPIPSPTMPSQLLTPHRARDKQSKTVRHWRNAFRAHGIAVTSPRFLPPSRRSGSRAAKRSKRARWRTVTSGTCPMARSSWPAMPI